MADIKIHLCLAHMSGLEQHYIRSAIESNWVAPLGPNVEKFEKSWRLLLDTINMLRQFHQVLQLSILL